MAKIMNPETRRMEEVDDYQYFDVMGYFPPSKSKRKIIISDISDLKSIKSAERRKAQYENMGLSLVKTEQIGFNKFRMVYE